MLDNTIDLFGRITIGDNCFIGARSVLLYSVTIPDNVIVAAGSVVTHLIKESNVVVVGNSARIISTWDAYKEKYGKIDWNLDYKAIDKWT